MSFLSEIGDYLATELSATLGTDLFLGFMPESPDACTAIYEYAGVPPQTGFGFAGIQHEQPGVQVVCRGEADDYTTPQAVAQVAYRKLAEVQGDTLGSTPYLMISPRQSPFVLRRDDQRRVLIVFNAIAEKELSS